MDDQLIHVGLGGAVALLLLRECLQFIAKLKPSIRSNGNTNKAGDKPPEYWEQKNREIAVDVQRPVLTILERQTDILAKIHETNVEIVSVLRERKESGRP